MAPMVDPFEGSGFGVVELSLAISSFPRMYGRLQQLKVFVEQGVTTRSVVVERENNTLSILPDVPVGAPATQNLGGSRDMRPISAYHVPLEDVLLPEDVQGRRKLGSTNEVESATEAMAKKLQGMGRKHSITLEAYLAGAIGGTILTANGATSVDLNAFWGTTEQVVDFDLDDTATNVRGKCMDVCRYIEDGLLGEPFDHVHALCDPLSFAALTNHERVKEEFRHQASLTNRDDIRKGFNFGGILFEEYSGKAAQPNGTVRKFIPDNTMRFFPVGSADAFHLWWAPGDFIDTANTIGVPLYAMQERRKFNRGWDLHTQFNPLPFVARPNALVRGGVNID